MGVFDTFLNMTRDEYDDYYNKKIADPTFTGSIEIPGLVDVQLKVGDPCCDTYCIGSEVPKNVKDGLYLGHDGFVAIFGGKLVGVYNDLKNSNGTHVLCEAKDINFSNTETWSTLYGKTVKTGDENKSASDHDQGYNSPTPPTQQSVRKKRPQRPPS